MPADKGGVTAHRVFEGEWLRVRGMVRVVGLGGDGAFLLETKPEPASVQVRRKRRNLDREPPHAQ